MLVKANFRTLIDYRRRERTRKIADVWLRGIFFAKVNSVRTSVLGKTILCVADSFK